MAQAYRFFPDAGSQPLEKIQLQGLRWTVRHAYHGSPFYRKRLQQAGVGPDSIETLDDIRSLPCTTADDLRAGYPFPLLSVPEEQVVRIHASSGTTGKRKILAYTARDLEEWKLMMARCYELAGLTTLDRVQIAVGYGLWTAGVGFQLGCEHFGAMALPLGPGNLEFQLQFLEDLQPTCACCTASMALLLAEQVEKNGLRDRLSLHTLIFGSEPHTPKMAKRIRTLLGVRETFDITG
ncbi:MAG: phenylacetate--CoA ligase family protein, partial [Deltaproteobacteria bacterium]|nr:phenylacetate--CoA ligase family protein [Deltaproteobacteria bacterium]